MATVTRELTPAERWRQKQAGAEPSRYYGDGGTIHSTNHLDIETDFTGEVVAVWFRCQLLPFKQAFADRNREDSMRAAYADGSIPALTGVEVLDREGTHNDE